MSSVEFAATEKQFILLNSTWNKGNSNNKGLKSLNIPGGKLILFKIIV